MTLDAASTVTPSTVVLDAASTVTPSTIVMDAESTVVLDAASTVTPSTVVLDAASTVTPSTVVLDAASTMPPSTVVLHAGADTNCNAVALHADTNAFNFTQAYDGTAVDSSVLLHTSHLECTLSSLPRDETAGSVDSFLPTISGQCGHHGAAARDIDAGMDSVQMLR